MRLFRIALLLQLLVLFYLFRDGVSSGQATTDNIQATEERQEKLERLFQKATSLPTGSSRRIRILENIHKLEPTHVLTRILLAMDLIASSKKKNDSAATSRAMKLLDECFDPLVVGEKNALAETTDTAAITPKVISPQVFSLSNFLARHFYEVANYKKSLRFAQMALDISSRLSSFFPQANKEEQQNEGGDVCTALQLATMLDPFPPSMQAADQALAKRHAAARAFLDDRKSHQQVMNQQASCAMLIGAAEDPYTHCVMTLFHLSFYYRADVKLVANQHFLLAAAAWPDLLYVAPHVLQQEKQQLQKQMQDADTCLLDQQSKRRRRKIKLGIISAAITEGHPVTEDFSGVLQRLDRSIFNVTYILVEAGKNSGVGMASFTKVHSDVDQTYVYGKDDEKDQCNAAWVRRLGKEIEKLEFDMILYLDLTMSGEVRRLGMQRLAPVQLNTHGHPITSGHNRSIIQYFVSWQEAELPAAQDHYTEELVLIPKGKIHQYYEPRILHVGQQEQVRVSRMDKFPFGHLTRNDFDLPNDVTIYLCMQKPFKLHPEFDHLICGILRKHPTGHVVLHRADHQHTHDLFVERLQRAGCDDDDGDDTLERVHFVPQQPHHRLLALYQHATVILDSYPAGGCTTTREVLELGKPLVTLPAKLLGSRWTLGYFNVIDLAAHAKESLVADSEQEFINLAVELGTNKTKRRIVEEAVREAAPRLFHRQEAVEEWQRILLEASPVKICKKDDERYEL